MGNLPTTHHDHTAQGTQPTYEDTSLTTSRPAPHKSAHEAFGTMELDELCESRPLHECFSNAEKTLDEIEGQLFPEFDGTERPRAVRILGEEWAEGKLKALFFRVNNKLYAYVDNAAQQAYGNIRMGVPPCHDHSWSVPVVPLEDTSILVRVHLTGLVHNRTCSTSPLRVSALRTGYACH